MVERCKQSVGGNTELQHFHDYRDTQRHDEDVRSHAIWIWPHIFVSFFMIVVIVGSIGKRSRHWLLEITADRLILLWTILEVTALLKTFCNILLVICILNLDSKWAVTRKRRPVSHTPYFISLGQDIIAASSIKTRTGRSTDLNWLQKYRRKLMNCVFFPKVVELTSN